MSHFELCDKGTSSVLILGIDPGTTGAKIAFLKAYEVDEGDKLECIVDPADRIHMLSGFPGYRQSNVSTLPTCLIYNERGRLFRWGHEAINFQIRHNVDPKYLITNWKLKLLESSRQGSLETASPRLGKPRGGFATDFFGALTNYLFNEPTSCLLSHFGIDDESLRQFNFIDVVIAMPPGWKHEEHTVFRDAAKKALAIIPNVRVITVSETECALRSWMSQEGRSLHIENGEIVILLDLGGGTACLSAFCYVAATQKWIHLESYSLSAGSELVTAKFELDFLERFRQTKLRGTTKALYRARKEFDFIKMGVGEDDEPEFWDCPVEGLLREEGTDFQDGYMRFTSQKLRSYFEPLQVEIIDKLEKMVTRLGQARRKPKYCVLAGAYARNILFLKRLHEANDSRMQMQIFRPQNLAELVATGACLTRVEGDCRLASGSRISVGIMTFIRWRDVMKRCPDAHHFLLEGEGRILWCRVITWVIKKGDDANPEKATIDHDGKLLRRRYIESHDRIIFTETICTSEAHPGKDQYTVLMYGTDDSGRRNKQDFERTHGMPLNIHEFTLDFTDKPVIQKDGSEVAMKNASFKHNHSGKYFEYKYYMNMSQTDCRVSIEAFSANGKTRRMLLQYSIPAFEVESAELQDEHRFNEQLSEGKEPDYSYGVDSGNAESSPSGQDVRGVRTNDNHRRFVHDIALSTVTEGIIYQQSRQGSFPTPVLLHHPRPSIERRSDGLHEDSVPVINGAPNSQCEPSDVVMATRAMKNAMAAKTRSLKDQQQQGRSRSSPEAQSVSVRKRARATDSTRPDYARVSGLITSADQWTPEWQALDYIFPTAESDDSDYQPTKKPAKKPCTPSLKDPVTKHNRSGQGVRKK